MGVISFAVSFCLIDKLKKINYMGNPLKLLVCKPLNVGYLGLPGEVQWLRL